MTRVLVDNSVRVAALTSLRPITALALDVYGLRYGVRVAAGPLGY